MSAAPLFVLVDVNAMFVSCERAFNPRLANVPVIVLSSNDGNAEARSDEAKKLDIKMGQPFFQGEYSGLIATYGQGLAIATNVIDQTIAGWPRAFDELIAIEEVIVAVTRLFPQAVKRALAEAFGRRILANRNVVEESDLYANKQRKTRLGYI